MAAENPLRLPDVLDCSVDDKGFSNSGGWKCALLIIERSAYYGISGNLMAYLTGPLGQSTATAAENLNFWSGTAWLLPLLGAIVADSFLGRYRTIIVAALIYILGLSLLTLSAVLPPVRADDCQSADTVRPCSPDPILILFFFALYLVAFGQGGFRPCVQAFGADQFDGQDPEERKAKSSFFNWWNSVSMPAYSIRREEELPILRIGQVFVAAFRNWRISPATSFKEDASFPVSRRNPEQFEGCKCARFLNKALLEINGSEENRRASTPREVEEAKALLRLVPTWITCLIFAIVSSQVGTFFTRQARTMNRSISEHLEFPAASIQLSIPVAVTVLVPIYDRVFVPVARRLTGEHSGITMLQRIGTGLFLSAVAMVVAALIEIKRLETAEEYGLVDMPNATIPMSGWWLIPQLVLIGAADVFTIIGLQEFFYDQVPGELKSVGLSLFLSVVGAGNFLSGFLVSVIDKTTGKDGWFANNLNRAHLDYFYWLLAFLSVVQLVAFLYFAKSYIYNRGSAV
ncbi:hypothetical protein DKX38_019992 [Salix brachista]|uniref:Major facilitator superfamily (MFS) profile domain-containing protein n=1 Tax=Salix brachista TaxID=2182728 RepID=A0A5N5KHW6_9ROSI|nr:hypothetical protein DKX38_019992 [Salix brachista]